MIKNNLPFEVYGNKDLIQDKKPVCITFGNFDGVHLGHKHLIESMKSMVQNSPIVIVTFDPHSSDYFSPHNQKSLLTNLSNKISLLLSYGASAVVVQKFDEKFASLTADDFCEHWLNTNFNINYVILGHDFCYGKNRQGDFSHMESYGEKQGWIVSQISALEDSITKKEPVSSSIIRNEISLGNMENVENLLGRPYTLSGIVVHGDHKGRGIGFPTANLKLDCNYVIPKHGVYACFIEIDYEDTRGTKLFPAVMNCGVRPSMSDGLKLQIEAHILNFDEDIYEKKIKFYPKKYIRGEQKFSDLEQLKKQICEDIISANLYFNDNIHTNPH
ncbi:MAG: bifunctional riboflavin kinase/FAD synthetase [Bdellovibrionota bacterium]